MTEQSDEESRTVLSQIGKLLYGFSLTYFSFLVDYSHFEGPLFLILACIGLFFMIFKGTEKKVILQIDI